jgi:predicted secreted protein
MKKVLLGLMLMALAMPLVAATPNGLIQFKATEFIEVLPDTAIIQFNYSVEKGSLAEVLETGRKIQKNIQKKLSDLKIVESQMIEDQEQTQSYFQYEEKRDVFIYRRIMQIRTDNLQLGATLERELNNENIFEPAKAAWFSRQGLNVGYSVNYEILKNKNKVELDLLEKTLNKGKEKLARMAATLKVKTKLSAVTEDQPRAETQPVYRVQPMMMKAMDATPENTAAPAALTPTLQRIYQTLYFEAEIL